MNTKYFMKQIWQHSDGHSRVLNDFEMITLNMFDYKLLSSFPQTNDSHIMLY